MVKFRVPDELRYDMPTHFALAERIAKEISDTFPGCITLEFEKCYMVRVGGRNSRLNAGPDPPPPPISSHTVSTRKRGTRRLEFWHRIRAITLTQTSPHPPDTRA